MKKKTLILISLCAVLVLVLIVPLVLMLSGGKYNSIERYKEGVKMLIHLRDDGTLVGHGSAFVINNAGNIITNAHVVGNDFNDDGILEDPLPVDVFYVVYEKQLKNRKVVVMQRAHFDKMDASRDLALLRVNSPDRAYFKPLSLARTASAGAPVKALGFPGIYDTSGNKDRLIASFAINLLKKGIHQFLPEREELEWSASMRDLLDVTSVSGAISKINDNYQMGTNLCKDARLRAITHNATTHGGMSGGPLINEDGQVVGVTYGSRIGEDSINNAIDVSELLHFITPAGGDPNQVAIIEGNPDSPIYILRAHFSNMSAGEVVVVVVGGLFVICCVGVLCFMLIKKRKSNSRVIFPAPIPSPSPAPVPSPSPSPMPNPYPNDPTIPMPAIANGPQLLFNGVKPNGEPIRYRVPLSTLKADRFLLIGRSSSLCKLHVADDNMNISRQQARIMYEEDTSGNVYLYIRDEQATNTTCLNGVPLIEKCLLMPGDVITFGGATLKFTVESA